MPKSKKSAEDWLPSDDVLFTRTKQWAHVFTKYNKDEDESLGVPLREIPRTPSSERSADTDSHESIPVSEFEDTEERESDPNFDVEKVFNQTMKVIEKRKKKWHRCGIDKLMDSFCMEQYEEKVENWLCSNAGHFSRKGCKHDRNGAVACIDKVEIKDRRVYVANSDQDSDQSVDTAKYILSNTKKQKTRYRTMTIKRYCYSRRRIEELDQKGPKRGLCVYDERFSEFGGKRNTVSGSSNDSLPTPKYRPRYNSESPKQKYGKRHRGRPVPSGSSSDSTFSPGCAERLRRSGQSKKRYYIKPSSSSIPSSIDNSSCPDFSRSEANSEIRFCAENVVNSTALSSKLPTYRKELLPIPENNESAITCCNKNTTSSDSKTKPSTPSPIVVYSPDAAGEAFQNSTSNGKVVLTGKLLESFIGPDLTKIYLKDKELSYEFDRSSRILFYPPEEVVQTSDSEADILEQITSNTTGRIVEILNPK